MKILLRNLTKRFPDRNKKTRGEITAVNDLTLEIPDGKLVGLLGPSGCGKSTTLNLICGLEKATEGTIFFGDRDVTALEPEHRGVGMVFQNYALYPHLTVRQNIQFPLENLKGKDKLTKEELKRRVDEAAKLVQIDELMENGLLAKSVGMLTDSRSFSSFPRHEYYRRILCQRLGELAESGQYPADERTLGQIVENICGKNAAAFLYL
mgnify:CR=1 FL=1